MIQLDENYRIEIDPNNFILKFEKETNKINEKTNKPEISRNEWYYPKLHLALDKYVNESLKDSQSIQELKEGMERINQTIKNIQLK